MDEDAARRELLGLLSGYWFSQSLYVLASLDVAEALADGPRTAGDIAADNGADAATLHRFLRAAADTGLLLRQDDTRFATTPILQLLHGDRPDSLKPLALLAGHPRHWRAWGGLLDAVRTGECAFQAENAIGLFDAMDAEPGLAAAFRGAMSFGGLLDAEVADDIAVPPGALVVDVGGGSGEFLERLLSGNPGSRGMVFDRQSVPVGKSIDDRIEWREGDFLDSVPADGDVYLLRYVLHNWNDDDALRILGNCRRAMRPGAALLIIEGLLSDDGSAAMANRHDLNMLVLTGGRERSATDYAVLLRAAGLEHSGIRTLASGVAVIQGRRSPASV